MKRINRSKAIGCWTIPTNTKCDVCGAKAEHFMNVKTFWRQRFIAICHNCRIKWFNGEINI
jgi:hypothetical protein